MVEWYYIPSGRPGDAPEGPVDTVKIFQLSRRGQITADSLVRKDDMTEFVPARTQAWLFPDGAASTPAPTASPAVAPDAADDDANAADGEWYFAEADGQGVKAAGPISPEALRKLARAGRIRPNSQVWKAGMATPVKAGTLEWLFAKAEAAPAPVHQAKAQEFQEPSAPRAGVPRPVATPAARPVPAPTAPRAPTPEAHQLRCKFFRAGAFTTWENLFMEVERFGTSIGPERLVSISHSAENSEGIVAVWYWE
jgi:hypothetical protein